MANCDLKFGDSILYQIYDSMAAQWKPFVMFNQFSNIRSKYCNTDIHGLRFNELKNQRFEFITDVYAQEICLYSDKYRVAGRADCIANYQHQLSVIDFKTSTNERKDSYNENYYIQTAAYASMFEEITGQPINQIVILVVTENGTVQEFIKDKKDYIPLLEETLDEWYKTCK